MKVGENDLITAFTLDGLDENFATYRNPHTGAVATVPREDFESASKPTAIMVVVQQAPEPIATLVVE